MVEGDTFRQVTGQFATGVTVVTVSGTKTNHGMTVNSFASVSIEPPLVLFNADKGTNTHDLVEETDHYAVNVLTADQQWISDRFAGEHHEMDDPFEDIPTTQKTTGAPVIEDTLAYIDCTVHDAFPGGDHTIYVGHVEDLGIQEDEATPLTFFRGKYGTIS
jgi:3-hydroxy-9,10-secoandrosta-1,3,5(10)-triene-9,17-dione monooxygenase reductase component